MFFKKYLLLLLLLFVASFVLAQTPSLRAVRIEQAPVLDGSLSDPCWQSAAMVTGFVMVEPNPDAPVTQPTKAYVCYDEQNLYLAAYMYEDQPGQIQAACNQRDGAVYYDDCLEVTIDTYNDKNNAYYFAVNLQGTRTDGRIIDEGRTIDSNWDCQWQARAGRAVVVASGGPRAIQQFLCEGGLGRQVPADREQRGAEQEQRDYA